MSDEPVEPTEETAEEAPSADEERRSPGNRRLPRKAREIADAERG